MAKKPNAETLTNSKLEDDILMYPRFIRDQETKVLNKTIELDDMVKEYKTWENEMYSEVSEELKGDGKLRFTNDTLRYGEIENRKTKHILLLDKQIKEAKKDLELLKIDLNYCYNVNKNLRAIAFLRTNKMEL